METITDFKITRMSLQLIVAELESAIEFYTEKLGFSIDFRYEDFYVGIIKEEHSIHLKHGEPSPEKRQNNRVNEHLSMMFSVRDFETVFDHLSAKSVDMVQPLREMPYGKEFYIADPDGHLIGFIGQE